MPQETITTDFHATGIAEKMKLLIEADKLRENIRQLERQADELERRASQITIEAFPIRESAVS